VLSLSPCICVKPKHFAAPRYALASGTSHEVAIHSEAPAGRKRLLRLLVSHPLHKAMCFKDESLNGKLHMRCFAMPRSFQRSDIYVYLRIYILQVNLHLSWLEPVQDKLAIQSATIKNPHMQKHKSVVYIPKVSPWQE